MTSTLKLAMQRSVHPVDNLQSRLTLRLAIACHQYNLSLLALVAEEERQAELVRRKRRWWGRPWLMSRPVYGQFESLMTNIIATLDRFLRMEPQMFHDLLQRVGPSFEKSPEQVARQPLPAGLKLAITLRFLVTGNSYRFLEFAFGFGACSAARRVPGIEVTASLRLTLPNGARSDFKFELKSIRRPRGAKNRPAAVGKPAGLRPGPVRKCQKQAELAPSGPLS
ncbi:hypothetical protein Bbelb_276230 [Branchiostoma belcheri]|nr:hypothetical protein Bbelb_276230 [Branchiostoma belcheri]